MLRFFKKTFQGLKKTRKSVSNVFSSLTSKSYLEFEDIEALEDCLFQADISYSIISEITESLQGKDSSKKSWRERAEEVLISKISTDNDFNNIKRVIMLVGVNGSGKTTTAAKLAQFYKDKKESVCLVAADTFRAAAVEQISIWADRLGVRLVKNEGTSDSASIAFDGVQSGLSKEERVIIDTAGRLHTSVNLMNKSTLVYIYIYIQS